MLYEERFRDITAMIRHIGVTVRTQNLSAMGASGVGGGRTSGDGNTGEGGLGEGGVHAEGAVVQKVMEELRKTKVELEKDMSALRAFTQQAVGGEGDLWQLQDDVAKLETQVGPLKQQLQALTYQVQALSVEISSLVLFFFTFFSYQRS